MIYDEPIRKSLYSMNLFADQHPEHTESIYVIMDRLAARFELGDVNEAIASVAHSITDNEKLETVVGLPRHEARLTIREDNHPNIALCDRLEEIIQNTKGWEPQHTILDWLEMVKVATENPQFAL